MPRTSPFVAASDSQPAGLPAPSEAESRRRAALHDYQILDTGPEPEFDDLTWLAAQGGGTAIALLSLLDGERQWFKSRQGLALPELPAEHALCHHTLRAAGVLEVPDARQDPRFAHHPLVQGVPYIRFYAGAPLISPEGYALGTLCLLDTVPHQLSPAQREMLPRLARQAMSQLELRRLRLQLGQERRQLLDLARLAQGALAAPPGPDDERPTLRPGRDDLFVKQDSRLVRVPLPELYYAEALGDYVHLHTGRERLTVYGSLKELETRLPVREFVRVHRKYIVRLSCLHSLSADAAVLDAPRGEQPRLVTVPIGLSYKAGLLARLNLV